MAIKLLNYNDAKIRLRENVSFKCIDLDGVLKYLDRHVQERSDFLSKYGMTFIQSGDFVFLFEVWVDKPTKNYGYNICSTIIARLYSVSDKEALEEISLVKKNPYAFSRSKRKRQYQRITTTQKCI